jgi:predicted 3-demethylubiquinone-9 3-methyltransferase (glyoxalase superfamily)
MNLADRLGELAEKSEERAGEKGKGDGRVSLKADKHGVSWNLVLASLSALAIYRAMRRAM